MQGIQGLEGTVVGIGRVGGVGCERVTHQIVAGDGRQAHIVNRSGIGWVVEIAHQIHSAEQALGDFVAADLHAGGRLSVTRGIGQHYAAANLVFRDQELADTAGDHFVGSIQSGVDIIKVHRSGGGARGHLRVGIGAIAVEKQVFQGGIVNIYEYQLARPIHGVGRIGIDRIEFETGDGDIRSIHHQKGLGVVPLRPQTDGCLNIGHIGNGNPKGGGSLNGDRLVDQHAHHIGVLDPRSALFGHGTGSNVQDVAVDHHTLVERGLKRCPRRRLGARIGVTAIEWINEPGCWGDSIFQGFQTNFFGCHRLHCNGVAEKDAG